MGIKFSKKKNKLSKKQLPYDEVYIPTVQNINDIDAVDTEPVVYRRNKVKRNSSYLDCTGLSRRISRRSKQPLNVPYKENIDIQLNKEVELEKTEPPNEPEEVEATVEHHNSSPALSELELPIVQDEEAVVESNIEATLAAEEEETLAKEEEEPLNSQQETLTENTPDECTEKSEDLVEQEAAVEENTQEEPNVDPRIIESLQYCSALFVILTLVYFVYVGAYILAVEH